MKTLALLLLGLTSGPALAAQFGPPVLPPNGGRLIRPELHKSGEDFIGELWIAAGQSQMLGVNEGRDSAPGGVDRLPENVLVFDSKNRAVGWHFPFETPGGNLEGSYTNVSPAIAFLKRRSEAFPDRKIMLLFAVRGASGFTVQVDPQQNWAAPGSAYHLPGNLAETLGHRVLQAQKFGWEPTGVLWLQGEADTLAGPAVYSQEFLLLRDYLRGKAQNPNLPFFLGGIARFEWTLFPGGDLIDAALVALADGDPMSYFVTTEDMVPQADGLHFDANSSRILGVRYASIAQANIGGGFPSFVTDLLPPPQLPASDGTVLAQTIGLDGSGIFDSYSDALLPLLDIERTRAPNGFFYLQATWPNGEQVRWRQSSNPVLSKRDLVTGFAYLSSSPVFYGPEDFGGLCRTGATSLAFSFQPGKANDFTSGAGLFRTGPVEKVLDLGANNILWTPSGVLTTGVRINVVEPH